MKASSRPTKDQSLKRAIKKNTPLKVDTEVNDQVGKYSFVNRKLNKEVEGLPVKKLPSHLQADAHDETMLDAGYTRLGAGDIDASEDRDGKDLKRRS